MSSYSIIVPVYNRPNEVQELLQSLCLQTFSNFEVLIIEDGSTNTCESICKAVENLLDIRYFYKENTGQGFSRNFGFERAKGNYFIVFDSDVVVPSSYLSAVDTALAHEKLDAFGGPDAASPDFSALQKAISYAMTSVFTTGGIRGKKNNAGGDFQPRSFNMGLSRTVFEATGGFAQRDMGEDIELSLRMKKLGFKVGLIPEAFVYHKRRGNFRSFFKQVYSFGRTRLILNAKHKGMLKAVHFFPALFFLFCVGSVFLFPVSKLLSLAGIALIGLYTTLIFVDAAIKNRSIKVGFLSVIAVFVQLWGYGLGFLREGLKIPTT